MRSTVNPLAPKLHKKKLFSVVNLPEPRALFEFSRADASFPSYATHMLINYTPCFKYPWCQTKILMVSFWSNHVAKPRGSQGPTIPQKG